MAYMIDPPTGSAYGFPRMVRSLDKEVLEYELIKAKYPAKDIDFALKYMRVWKCDDNTEREGE